MKKPHEEYLRNGVELVLSLTLSMELLDVYKAKHLLKKKIDICRSALEEQIVSDYDRIYKKDPELVTNAMNKKNALISQVAKYNEPDVILFAEFAAKFDENIDSIREKGVIIFDKLQ